MKTIHVKHALRGPWTMDGEGPYEGPPPPGVLHGDRWDTATGAIERGAHGLIVGIVDFTAKTRYGFSSRGVPQYLFHPADPRFPPMIVGSKAPPTVNQWGLITTKGLVWSTTKSRWPSVQLQELLGPVGTPEVEAEVLRLRYLRPVHRTKSVSCDALLASSAAATAAWDTVFNIDPDGCRDVDDILAWRRIDGGIEFGIGIADVAALVPKDSDLDKAAFLRAQTLYRDGVAIEPMLPAAISEGRGSLLADGTPRGVLMATWRLEATETETNSAWASVHGPVWSRASIVNQRSFTYESVLQDSTISNILPRYLAAITGLSIAEVGADSHRWVELAMVTYNRAAADQVATTGILRRHRGITATEYQELAAKTGCAELAFLGYAAGEYVEGSNKIGVETGHAGLGVERYAHATSPLRRYADLVNQRILMGMLDAEDVRGMVVAGTAAWLNERAKEARACDREAWCLAQLSSKELREASGWVLGWTLIPNTPPEVRLRVYVPEWKRQVKVMVAFLGKDDGSDEGEDGGIRVGSRGSTTEETKSWLVKQASPVRITAFWDLRGTPEHRFVFRVLPALPALPG